MTDSIHIGLWIAFAVLVVVSLVVDLGVHRKPSRMSTREAALWAGFWIALGVAFGLALWAFLGAEASVTFFTAFLLEKSLSVDNLFVFLVVFSFFRIPLEMQHRVLFWGILGAVLMRAVFIFLGVALLSRFEWLFYVFGAFLIYTAIKLLFSKKDDEFDPSKNLAYRIVKALFPVTDELHGGKFFAIENGKKVATRVFVVLAVIEATDLVFAVDSIPAVLAITQDVFIVYTSNIFAILGLRALYFLLADVMVEFRYLNVGLAVVLAFIGVKMIGAHFFHIPPLVSLAVVGLVLGASIAAWVIVDRREKRHAGAANEP